MSLNPKIITRSQLFQHDRREGILLFTGDLTPPLPQSFLYTAFLGVRSSACCSVSHFFQLLLSLHYFPLHLPTSWMTKSCHPLVFVSKVVV